MLTAIHVTDAAALPGRTATVAVAVDDATGIEGFHFVLEYDAGRLTLDESWLGGLFAGIEGAIFAENATEAGRVVVAGVVPEPLAGGSGELVAFDFLVAADAPVGTTPLDLAEGSLNDGGIALDTDPVDGSDATDGSLTVAGARLAARVVLEPTAAGDGLNESTGEIAALPVDAAALHEWQSFVVEVYADTPSTDGLDVQGGEFELNYASSFYTAVGVEAGPGFTLAADTTDDASGTVNVAVTATRGELGDDVHVLLARVEFASIGEDNVPMDFANRDFGPFGLGIGATGDVLLETVGEAEAEPASAPTTELFPVALDTGDNGRVDFGDLGRIAGVFLERVEPPETIPADPADDPASPDEIPADVNGDGVVNFGDVGWFVANFLKARGETLSLPPDYFDALRRGREWYGGSAATTQTLLAGDAGDPTESATSETFADSTTVVTAEPVAAFERETALPRAADDEPHVVVESASLATTDTAGEPFAPHDAVEAEADGTTDLAALDAHFAEAVAAGELATL